MGFELIYLLGAAVLVAALIWAAFRYRTRRPGQRMVGDRKTEELYRRQSE